MPEEMWTSSSRASAKIFIGFCILVSGVSFVLSWGGYQLLKQREIAAVEQKLTAVHDSTLRTLQFWLSDQYNQLNAIAATPRIQHIVDSQVNYHQIGKTLATKELNELRAIFTDVQSRAGHIGFFVIAEDGITIGSMRDVNMGRENIIMKHRPDLIKRVFAGEKVLIPPIPSDVPIPGEALIAGSDMPATMFIAVPVRNGQGRVIAVLTERFRPSGVFSEILALGRLGQTGENYLFDQQGYLLTSSRFPSELQELDMLSPGDHEILSIRLLDPGDSDIDSSALDDDEAHFTLMAESALAGNSGSNLDGYGDYRGKSVVGVWSWEEELGVGLASEQDWSEAYAALEAFRWVITLVQALLTIVAVVATLAILRLFNRSHRSLLLSRDRLEEEVSARTQELNENQQFMQQLMDNIPAAVYLKGLDGRYLYANKMFDAEFVPDASDVIGKVDADIFPASATENRKRTDDLAISSESIQVELEEYPQSGNTQAFLSTKLPFWGERDEVSGILGISIDITERRKVEEQLKETLQKLEEAKISAEMANLAKNEFLANISHEIRTPMNGVLGMLTIVLESILTDEQKERLSIAKSSADTLLILLDEILDVSKIESGAMELETVSFTLSQELQQVIDIMRFKAEEKNLKLVLDTSDVTVDELIGDPTRLRQIILNLVSNALKFTEKGSVKIDAHTVATDDEIRLICAVTDTGVGIPKGRQHEIFKSFTQVDASTTRKYGGTGLGLTISKKLAKLMGGDLTIEDSSPDGTKFVVDVSLKAMNQGALRKDSQTDSISRIDTNQRFDPETHKVLLVEDNDVNLLVAEEMLKLTGVCVATARDGLEAIERLKNSDSNFPFQMIFLDCQMPELDGYETTRQIRAGVAGNLYRHTPIVAMTAHAMRGARETCLQAGMDDYLTKPLSLEAIRGAVASWLG